MNPSIEVTFEPSINVEDFDLHQLDADALNTAITERAYDISQEEGEESDDAQTWRITGYTDVPDSLLPRDESAPTEAELEHLVQFAIAVADIDEDSREEAFVAFLANENGSYANPEDAYVGFQDSYEGQYDSWEEFAEQLVDSLGYLGEMPQYLRNYFDYEKFGRDLQHDYSEYEGFYFRNI